MLEAAGATIRSDHLDALARLCEEKSLEDQDIHPLDNYHLEPAEATVTAASITADAGSDQKSRQWFKKGNRRYPDRQPEPTNKLPGSRWMGSVQPTIRKKPLLTLSGNDQHFTRPQ